MYETRTRLQTAAIVALLALAIELLGRMANPVSLVPISEMLSTIYTMFVDGTLVADIRTTATEVLVAFGLSTVAGVGLGVVLWRLEYVNTVLEPYFLSYYAVPIFALYPLFLAIFGLGMLPIIVIAWLYGTVVVVVNTTRGLNKVSETHVKVGRSFNLDPTQMLTKIYIPSAIPHVFTGLKLAFIFSVTGSIATEFIMAGNGLGHLIAKSYEGFQTGRMYAGILLIAAFAILINVGLLKAEARLHRGNA